MIIRFLAVILTGLAVIAPAAHLFELRHKMQMSEQDYFVVQHIYVGWWVVDLFLPAALMPTWLSRSKSEVTNWHFGLRWPQRLSSSSIWQFS